MRLERKTSRRAQLAVPYSPGVADVADAKPAGAGEEQMPDELSSSHLARPGCSSSPGSLVVVGVADLAHAGARGHSGSGSATPARDGSCSRRSAELLSTLSYVVVFRYVFCARMSWRLSYQIGMAEQAANSLLPAGGAGGLALGAWALSKGGMKAEHIARRTVAFFILTSLPNFVALILFAIGFAAGLLTGNRAPVFTYCFAGAAAIAIVLVLAVPRSARDWPPTVTRIGRERTHPQMGEQGDRRPRRRGARRDLAAADRPLGVLGGAIGYMRVRHRRARCLFRGVRLLPAGSACWSSRT